MWGHSKTALVKVKFLKRRFTVSYWCTLVTASSGQNKTEIAFNSSMTAGKLHFTESAIQYIEQHWIHNGYLLRTRLI